MDWLYGTKNPEEIKEDSIKLDPVVSSNMWEDEDNPIRGQVRTSENIYALTNKEPFSQVHILLWIRIKSGKWT